MGRYRPHLLLVGCLALAFGVDRYAEMIDPYVLDVAMGAGINVILAVSLGLITGAAGQFSLGHAGFMAVGAYLSAGLTLLAGPSLIGEEPSVFAQELLFFISLVTGGLGAALIGFFVGAPSLRLKGDYLALVTLGFGEIIRVVLQNIEPLGGALGLNGIPSYATPFWVISWCVVTVAVVRAILKSNFGRGFFATRDDEIAAESVGLNTTRYKMLAFVIGAFFAGVAGGLYGHFKLTITPTGFDFTKSIEIVVMVILGGMGRTYGVVAAALLLTLLPEVLRPIAEYRMIIYSLLLVLVMILRPQGLFAGKGKS